jgi:hypothetical protein
MQKLGWMCNRRVVGLNLVQQRRATHTVARRDARDCSPFLEGFEGCTFLGRMPKKRQATSTQHAMQPGAAAESTQRVMGQNLSNTSREASGIGHMSQGGWVVGAILGAHECSLTMGRVTRCNVRAGGLARRACNVGGIAFQGCGASPGEAQNKRV